MTQRYNPLCPGGVQLGVTNMTTEREVSEMRSHAAKSFLAALVLSAMFPSLLRAAEPLTSGEVRLTLAGAMIRSDGDPADLHLDLTVEWGKWNKDVWGYAMTYVELGHYVRSFCKSDHDGRLVGVKESPGRTEMVVTMNFKGSGWVSQGMKTVQEGRYTVRAKRTGNRFAGDFTGLFGRRKVTGKLTGTIRPFAVRAIKGYKPFAPGEHPRLIFRKKDIPAIRDRAKNTPEGRAIVAQLEKCLAKPLRWHPRVTPMVAAGHGVMYVLTGDKAHSAKARKITEGLMDLKASDRKMIRRAPRAMGMALTYDLCYEGWDVAFRRKVTNWLEEAALDIFNGGRTGGLNEHPFSNWMGIAYGSAGTIAIAIMGDPGVYPQRPVQPMPVEIARIGPPKKFTAGRGVPVVKYEDGKMPTQWLMAGPFKPRSDDDFLAAIGGRDKANPEAGTRAKYAGGVCAFKPIGKNAIWVHEHFTNGQAALDLLVPIDRAYHTTSYYYNVLDSARAGWFRMQSDTKAGGRGAVMWLAGKRVTHGDLVHLKKGRYPVMIQVSLGSTTPWGRILMAPRFVALSDEQAKTERAEREAAYSKRLAAWETGRKRYIESGKTVPTADYCYRRAMRGMRRFMQTHVGEHGFGLEGEGYLRFTMTCGLLQFLHANRVAMGREFVEGLGQDWLFVLPVITGVGPEGKRPAYGPAGWSNNGQQEERSGAFAAGMSNVRPEHLPAVRWWFDRTFGPKGDKSFNVTLPVQAGYALANYPFGVKEKNPHEVLPHAVLDRHHGYFATRKQWKDADDLLAVMHLKSTVRHYVHQANPAGSIRIVGFDRLLAQIVKVEMPGATTMLGGLGGQVEQFGALPDGSATVSACLDQAYLKDSGKGQPPADAGIRATRAFAVDYSEASGAAGLYAVIDRIKGGGKKTWRMTGAGDVKVSGKTFTVAGRDGVTLRGHVIVPAGAAIKADRRGVAVTGGDEFFVVMTVTRGDPPAVKASGKGLAAKVRVGKRSLRFDGDKIILAD